MKLIHASFPVLALILAACGDDTSGTASTTSNPTLPTTTSPSYPAAPNRVAGSTDLGFAVNGVATAQMRAPVAFASLADGTTYVAHGKAVYGVGSNAVTLRKFNALGQVDTSFGNGFGTVDFALENAGEISNVLVATQPDGRLTLAASVNYTAGYVGGYSLVARFLPAGNLDYSFGTSGIARFDRAYDTTIKQIDVDPVAGDVYFTGTYSSQGQYESALMGHLTGNGQRDTAFGTDGTLSLYGSGVTAFARQRGGQIVTLDDQGRFYAYAWNGQYQAPQRGYATTQRPLPITPAALAADFDGSLWVVGKSQVTSYAQPSAWSLYHLNADGSIDSRFGTDGFVSIATPQKGDQTAPTAVAIDQLGNLVIGGTLQLRAGTPAYGNQYDTNQNQMYTSALVVRVNRLGQVDTTFGASGWLTPATASDDKAVAFVATTNNGRVIVGSQLAPAGLFSSRAASADKFDLAAYFR